MKLACRATYSYLTHYKTYHLLFYGGISSDYIDCQKIAFTIKYQDKKLFFYHGIVIRRNYKDEKSLVKTNEKHGFHLKYFHFHNQLLIFFKVTARGLPLPTLATTSGTLACEGIPSSPLTTQVQ